MGIKTNKNSQKKIFLIESIEKDELQKLTEFLVEQLEKYYPYLYPQKLDFELEKQENFVNDEHISSEYSILVSFEKFCGCMHEESYPLEIGGYYDEYNTFHHKDSLEDSQDYISDMV